MIAAHHHRRQHPSTLDHVNSDHLNLDNLSLHSPQSHFLLPVPTESDVAPLSHSPSTTLDSSPATSTLDFSDPIDLRMPTGYSNGIQHTSPNPSLGFAPHDNRSSTSAPSGPGATFNWPVLGNAAAQVNLQPRFRLQGQHLHRRNVSDSTTTSRDSQSPYTPVSTAGHTCVLDSDVNAFLGGHFDIGDQQLAAVTSCPKPSGPAEVTFSDSTLFAPQFQNLSPQYAYNQSMWARAMRQAMVQQQQPPTFNGSNMTQVPDSGSDPSGNLNLLDARQRHLLERSRVPELNRTISDVYQDELYNPEEPTVPAPIFSGGSRPGGAQGSPRSGVFLDLLHNAAESHKAEAARKAVAVDDIARRNSPFRPDSRELPSSGYVPSHTMPAARGPFPTAAHIREQEKARSDAMAYVTHHQPIVVDNAKTVSPKDVSTPLEYEPEDGDSAPLIAPFRSPVHASGRPSKLHQELTRPEEDSYSSFGTMPQPSPPFAAEQSRQRRAAPTTQQYPFMSQQRHANANLPSSQESVPKFPASLVSMESTTSERDGPLSLSQLQYQQQLQQQQQQPPQLDLQVQQQDSRSYGSQSQSPASAGTEDSDVDHDIQRPDSTTADTGTYTCTYHGCTLRFETPTKLQKHKREGHRQGSPSGGSGGALADGGASGVRDSQAGPHKCLRTNPTTGKPCNSIFSRPYDLTRHEDTIHNNRKQKVRCHLCTEEKTFSRNDALTRHMRVVHPEVEFAGKTRRSRG